MLLLALVSNVVIVQEVLSKQIEESFDFSSESKLLLENKYGNIYILGSDDNRLSVTVDISATNENSKEAQALLDRIQPSIKEIGNQVIITSEIVKKEVGFLEKFFSKSVTSGKKAKSQINYTLHVPNDSRIELANKYGDVIVSEWNGELDVAVEHGDIRLPDGIEDARISIKYGKLKARDLISAKVDANDAVVEIENCQRLTVNSKGSELLLNEIGVLALTSSKDEMEIEGVNSLEGTVTYSNVKVSQLVTSADMVLKWAELRVLDFASKGPSVRIEQDNSEIYLNISNTSFQFHANLEQGVLRIPKTMNHIKSELLDRKRKIRNISATYGVEKEAVFSFTGRKGIIMLKEL